MTQMTTSEQIKDQIINALEDIKGKDITSLAVGHLTSVTDWLVIVSGTSNRHVKSLADNVISELKKDGLRPIGTEGLESGEWALVDFGDVVVHVMLPEAREFYDLERLWSELPEVDDNGIEE